MKDQIEGTSENKPSAISVSAAMSLAKGALENVIVRIVGEVSEVSNKAGYKAVYFTVKDESAALPCMMWNNRYRSAGVELAVGQLVEISGRFSLYAAKGRMNFDVFSIALAGEGNLRLQVANLARKLDAEGLFAPTRKRPVSRMPERIGLVTSPRGAAVHDVLRTLRRRFPLAEVLLAGVPVEGAGAPAAIIEGMRAVVQSGADVVLVVRGGGSFEDLMPFNDEALVRKIAACPVPVVTGIGHEPDTSIADMAADLRASTPTAAAEAVSVSIDAVRSELRSAMGRMRSSEESRVHVLRSSCDKISMRPIFQEPMRLFEGEARRIDDLADRLSTALPRSVEKQRERVDRASVLLAQIMSRGGSRESAQLAALRAKMSFLGKDTFKRFENMFSVSAARLNDLSPLGVIARGYGMVQDGAGLVVSSIKEVSPGDELTVTVSDGTIACIAERTEQVNNVLERLGE